MSTSSFRGASQQHEVVGTKHQIHVYVSAEQHRLIKLKARALSVSVSRFLVRQALATDVQMNTEEVRAMIVEMRQLSRTLSGIATNINQMAMVINSGGTPTGSLSSALAEVKRVSAKLADNQTRFAKVL